MSGGGAPVVVVRAIALSAILAQSPGLCARGVAQTDRTTTSEVEAPRRFRVLFGVDEFSLAVEGDLVRWGGASLTGSVHRCPMNDHGCAGVLIEGPGAPVRPSRLCAERMGVRCGVPRRTAPG